MVQQLNDPKIHATFLPKSYLSHFLIYWNKNAYHTCLYTYQLFLITLWLRIALAIALRVSFVERPLTSNTETDEGHECRRQAASPQKHGAVCNVYEAIGPPDFLNETGSTLYSVES